MFSLALNALEITQIDPSAAMAGDPTRLAAITTFTELKRKLDEHEYLNDRYIILPNVSGEGEHLLLRKGQAERYIEMPCLGGYTDGGYHQPFVA
ncbi:hypothetical protein [uncultured Roseobacter sp.]|uniref:hypothetical protein n=1 Tax=uncultured Roseobacter sp. TaxID=114847 RepID=UPI0026288E05|nr:hypothetical protein [uncultured Roseobacter sp.]